MRILIASLLAATALTAANLPSAPARSAQADPTEARFAALSKRYVDGIARLSPTYATTLGNHAHDSELPDLSAKGRAASAAFDRELLADLGKIDRTHLSRDSQVDAAMLD